MNTLKDFIGVEVALYPNDSYKKNAILKNIDENGYLFEVTNCQVGSGKIKGEILFFNHANAVVFSNKLNKF